MSGSGEGLCLPTDAEAEAEAAITASECNNGLLMLPDEVQLHIYSWLAAPDMCTLACVCKRLSFLATDVLLWRALARKHHPAAYTALDSRVPDIGDVDMKDFYKHRVETDRRFWSGLPVHHDAIAVGASHTAQMAVFGAKLIDEDRVLTATSDGIMSVRSLASQEELVRVSMPGGTLGLAYSPAERRAICGNFDSSVYIWDLNAGTRDDLDAMRVKELKTILTRNGVSYRGCVERSDLVDKILDHGLVPPATNVTIFNGHATGGPVPGVATHGNLAFSGSRDGTRAWRIVHDADDDGDDGDDGREVAHIELIMQHPTPAVDVVAVSPRHNLLSIGTKGACVGVYNIDTMQTVAKWSEHEAWIWCLEMNPDDPFDLYSGACDATVRRWDTRVGNAVEVIPLYSPPEKIAGLKVLWDRNLMLASTFAGKVFAIDTRKPSQGLYSLTVPDVQLTRMDANHDTIVVGGFSKNLYVWKFAEHPYNVHL